MKKIIFYNILIFFLVIVSLEIFARILNLSPLLGISENLLDRSEEPYQNQFNIEATAFGKKVFTDSYGFRIPTSEFKQKKENNSVLILGDSVGFGVGVNDNMTVTGLMRKEHKNLNFYNSSVVGYNLKNYYQILKKYKNIDNLKDVILFFCINDIHNSNGDSNFVNLNEKEKKFDIVWALREIKIFNKLNEFLRSKSVFYLWVKNIIHDNSKRYFMYDLKGYDNESNVLLVKNYFNDIKDITIKNNLNLYVIIIPFEFQTRSENCKGSYMLPQEKIKKIVNKLKIKSFDYSKNFCSKTSPSKLFLKYDPSHLSEEGHKFLAQLIKKDIFSKK